MGGVEVANCPGATGISSFSQVNAAGGVNATGALPVDLLYFNAKEQDDNILLEWATASELNSDIYELYYSEDENEYIKFDEVKAAGNSNSILNYAVTLPKGNQAKLYFKLKQIDIDGEFEEYKTILKISSVKPLMVFPNPFRDELNIRLSADELQSPKLVQLVNLEGVTIASDYLYQSTDELSFDTQSLRAGMYLLVVDNATFYKMVKL